MFKFFFLQHISDMYVGIFFPQPQYTKQKSYLENEKMWRF